MKRILFSLIQYYFCVLFVLRIRFIQEQFFYTLETKVTQMFSIFSFPLEEFIYNYLITLSFYIIPKKGV